jgi:hypothetical protein
MNYDLRALRVSMTRVVESPASVNLFLRLVVVIIIMTHLVITQSGNEEDKAGPLSCLAKLFCTSLTGIPKSVNHF